MLGIIALQDSGFVTRWTVAGDAAARTISLPLSTGHGEAYNCTVDWGDGSPLSTITAWNDPDRVHTYAGNGTYDVKIRGACGGWWFSNAGDKLKIVAVLNWGDPEVFDGFTYLENGFYGCSNLTSLAAGGIPADSVTSLINCFSNCASLTSLPTDLFRYTTAVTNFSNCFYGCTSLVSLPTDLFRHNTAVTFFSQCFQGCTSLVSLPTDLFRYNTAVTDFRQCFQDCTSLVSLPTDLFRYNTAVTFFSQCFQGCTSLVSLPPDLFRHNTTVDTFELCFSDCTSLASLPADLFRYNLAVTWFSSCFSGCDKLRLRSDMFYVPGDETSRFATVGAKFTDCFNRGAFTGAQGTAPNLWTCVFGGTIVLDTPPATDWDPDDVITGQTSGAQARVVSKEDDYNYRVAWLSGTFQEVEEVGVTGVPAKLATQGNYFPVCNGAPYPTGCFGGAGNSLASIDNYASIPAEWK